jgi:hypothetical protein
MTNSEVIQILKNDIELSKMNVNFCHNNEYGIRALQMAIKALEQPRWIPVSERLPEDEQEILFSTKTGRVHSGKYHDDDSANQWYSHRDKCRAWNNVVNAWMPLPEPYQGGKHTCSECIIKDTDACSRWNTEADEVACEDFVGGDFDAK